MLEQVHVDRMKNVFFQLFKYCSCLSFFHVGVHPYENTSGSSISKANSIVHFQDFCHFRHKLMI